MFEVILYAAIATIICVMLYSVLGKDVGKGSDSAINPDDFMNKVKPQDRPAFVEPINEDMSPSMLSPLLKRDPNFSKRDFVEGARTAYPMILEAFADGDRDVLNSLLSSDVYELYEQTISEREEANQKQITDLGRLVDTRLVACEVEKNKALLSVEYEADIASAVLNEAGETILGDPDMLARVKEIWMFEKDLKSSDPTWRLVDVAPSTGDDLAADPTPDTQK
ncbi:MAG: Tim44/TimA family putative adaptor protein [Maricaulaceae bacterium]